MERLQADITYFSKNFEFSEIRNKYLLNFKDHFSKYCKSFIIDNKRAETILEKLKIIIKEWESLIYFILIMAESFLLI